MISSFAFPIIFKENLYLTKFKKLLKIHKIEFRPIIAGNLLEQPFLKKNYNNYFRNSNLISRFGVYIGNNQFVNKKKISLLNNIFLKIF